MATATQAVSHSAEKASRVKQAEDDLLEVVMKSVKSSFTKMTPKERRDALSGARKAINRS